MLKEYGMYYDNVNPAMHRDLRATNYATPFYKPQLDDDDTRPTTASGREKVFGQTGFDLNDRSEEGYDAYEQTGFDANDREDNIDVNEKTGGPFDVNDREEEFDPNERTGFDVNDRDDDDFDVNDRTGTTLATVKISC